MELHILIQHREQLHHIHTQLREQGTLIHHLQRVATITRHLLVELMVRLQAVITPLVTQLPVAATTLLLMPIPTPHQLVTQLPVAAPTTTQLLPMLVTPLQPMAHHPIPLLLMELLREPIIIQHLAAHIHIQLQEAMEPPHLMAHQVTELHLNPMEPHPMVRLPTVHQVMQLLLMELQAMELHLMVPLNTAHRLHTTPLLWVSHLSILDSCRSCGDPLSVDLKLSPA